jgi:AcrR family transcriptional regulator
MPSDGTRDRLLQAAAEEIARHGLKGASLRDVATRAEIKAASIFHYFPGGKPTIGAAHGVAPADLIVQCAALFWDYLAENPECAGVLMREAFAPDEAVAEVVQGNARRVVKLAVHYIEAAQRAGLLAAFDVRRFLLRLATFTTMFHAAPAMRRSILGAQHSLREEREVFLTSLRAEVAVRAERSAG